jgi:hypothetical protein
MGQILNSHWYSSGLANGLQAGWAFEATLGEDYKSLSLLGTEASHPGCQFTHICVYDGI